MNKIRPDRILRILRRERSGLDLPEWFLIQRRNSGTIPGDGKRFLPDGLADMLDPRLLFTRLDTSLREIPKSSSFCTGWSKNNDQETR